MHGIFISGQRPRNKKDLVEVVRHGDLSNVWIEGVHFAFEYCGRLDHAPRGKYLIIGPDPPTQHNWYATITVGDDPVASISIR